MGKADEERLRRRIATLEERASDNDSESDSEKEIEIDESIPFFEFLKRRIK